MSEYHADDLAAHVADDLASELDGLLDHLGAFIGQHRHATLADVMAEFDIGPDEARELLKAFSERVRRHERQARGEV